MKIYDCIIFNGENSILEIRLNELNELVDQFVIIEFRLKKQKFTIYNYEEIRPYFIDS